MSYTLLNHFRIASIRMIFATALFFCLFNNCHTNVTHYNSFCLLDRPKIAFVLTKILRFLLAILQQLHVLTRELTQELQFNISAEISALAKFYYHLIAETFN